MGNKLRNEGDEVRIKVIWPDIIIYSHACCLQCVQMMSQFRPFPCESWLGHARSRMFSLQGYCRRHITKIHQETREWHNHIYIYIHLPPPTGRNLGLKPNSSLFGTRATF